MRLCLARAVQVLPETCASLRCVEELYNLQSFIMNLQHLKAFYTTAKLSSISKAAKQLHITQPALSMQLQSLEHELQVTLLNRSNKGVNLTEAGLVVFDYANSILSMQDNVERDLKNLMIKKKELLLGSCKAVGEYALPCSIYVYKQDHQDVNINFEITNSETVMRYLIDRKINLGIIHGDKKVNNIFTKKITSDRLMLVSSNTAAKDTITLDEFKSMPLIFRECGSGTRETIESHLKSHNLKLDELNIIYELNSMEAIKASVMSGKGTSFLSELSIKREIKDGVLKEIKIEGLDLRSEFFLAYRQDYALSSYEQDFIDFIMSSKRGFC